jgi:hypothetical protein
MITFVIGLIAGYWLYPLRMARKLYKINKQLVQIELEHMKMMNDLKNGNWNEDNL